MEEGGLLGDLPRTRPGNRSPRRAPRAADTPPEPSIEPPSQSTPGAAGAAGLRLAVGAAEAGLKVASRVTAEVIRRLPRL